MTRAWTLNLVCGSRFLLSSARQNVHQSWPHVHVPKVYLAIVLSFESVLASSAARGNRAVEYFICLRKMDHHVSHHIVGALMCLFVNANILRPVSMVA